jgi:hypothetical protein
MKTVKNNTKATDLFLGIELEVENVKDADMGDILEGLPHDIYAKEDSSINHGCEFVSHPMTWEYLKAHPETWGYVLDLKREGFKSYKTDTCGMHIHLSKSAFGTLHLYKFLTLFYGGRANREFIYKVSRRTRDRLEDWATLEGSNNARGGRKYTAKNKMDEDGQRHCAVNMTNPHTIEIRIFRGTLGKKGFWANVEFCVAAWAYTKQCALPKVTISAFKDWVTNNKKEYPHFAEFLRTH